LPNGSYTWKIISKDTLIYPSNLRPWQVFSLALF
jgi:hypothetical protein